MREPEVAIQFDENGLVPAIIQDWHSGEVLMLGYMNAEALEQTLKTGEVHFWSRSRKALWHKGSTSGNIQRAREVRVDCDQDAILVAVDPAGPACHTGNTSCFYRIYMGQEGAISLETAPRSSFDLDDLFEIICSRRDEPRPGSYTSHLFSAGEDEIVKKVGEEAVEIILAAKSQGDQRLVEEIADLVFHVLVLLAWRGLAPTDILAELERRHRTG